VNAIPIFVLIALGAVVMACATSSGVASGSLPLRVLADVPLTGGSSRFDYQVSTALAGGCISRISARI
jgi:hypothetical protein